MFRIARRVHLHRQARALPPLRLQERRVVLTIASCVEAEVWPARRSQETRGQ